MGLELVVKGKEFTYREDCQYPQGQWTVQQYLLKADPYELNNLASKADPKLLAQFVQRMKDLATCKAAECRKMEDAPFTLK